MIINTESLVDLNTQYTLCADVARPKFQSKQKAQAIKRWLDKKLVVCIYPCQVTIYHLNNQEEVLNLRKKMITKLMSITSLKLSGKCFPNVMVSRPTPVKAEDLVEMLLDSNIFCVQIRLFGQKEWIHKFSQTYDVYLKEARDHFSRAARLFGNRMLAFTEEELQYRRHVRSAPKNSFHLGFDWNGELNCDPGVRFKA